MVKSVKLCGFLSFTQVCAWCLFNLKVSPLYNVSKQGVPLQKWPKNYKKKSFLPAAVVQLPNSPTEKVPVRKNGRVRQLDVDPGSGRNLFYRFWATFNH